MQCCLFSHFYFIPHYKQKLHHHLKNLQSDLGNVSRRCVSFFEEKPSSSSVPVLRSELNLVVEKSERLNSLSSIYLHKLVHSLTPPRFSYTPTLSVLLLSCFLCQAENGRCADEKLTGCWESGEEVWGTAERGGHSTCWYHCYPGFARTDKGQEPQQNPGTHLFTILLSVCQMAFFTKLTALYVRFKKSG